MNYFIYVLYSKSADKTYVGFTNDLNRRLKEHNKGDTKSTKSRRPFKLIYYEAHTSEEDARRREKYFKKDKGKSTLKQMMRNGLSRRQCQLQRLLCTGY